ncbi:hypothetical protein [Alkalihalophilus marmarensis]|uniref:Uncharacterized protein n=1 Tax=Alkalihalophilus marmarensis DSM 21297 TaxID=1188261 RepID=U6SL04_9BACI|nr:hypothetical protein [Alkalihalophilus marmarensis]ERN52067.1 hypothetical protein A33I_18415 [Alkalihalophilus marmarensis DSM 21297]
MEWEVLHLKVITQKKYFKYTELVDDFTRVRVINNNKIGVSLYHKGALSIENQLEQAILNLEKGDYTESHFQGPAEHYGDSNPIKKENFLERVILNYSIKTSNGLSMNNKAVINTIEKDQRENLFLLNSITFEDDSFLEYSWIISPHALSKIYYNEWLNLLIQQPADTHIPNNLVIRDRAHNLKVDLEGTKKSPIIFIKDGKIINRIRTIQSNKSKERLTGHSGLYSHFLTDFSVEPNTKTRLSTSKYLVVSDTYKVEKNIWSVTFTDRHNNQLTKFFKGNFKNILSHSVWLNSQGKGVFPWESPWLFVPEPKGTFREFL